MGKENIFHKISKAIVKAFKAVGRWFAFFGQHFIKGDIFTKLSFGILGLSNIIRGQIVKGLLFLGLEAAYIFYMIENGVHSLGGLRDLGTHKQGMVMDKKLGIFVLQKGDNSMLILLYGVVALSITIAFILLYRTGLKSALTVQQVKEQGKKPLSFREEVRDLFDKDLHKTLMTLPITGIVLFTVLPLFFMILIAFTNYDHDHQPPGNLFTWVGLENFKTILFSGQTISYTFWHVLAWTIIWAIFATGLNYLGGILLALLINRKETRGKGLWRTLFVISIAVPQFVSLLVVRTMLNNSGAVNALLHQLGLIPQGTYLPFLSDPTWARITVIIVNLWVGIPYTMLITTGILANIPADLYESARVDGAKPVTMFFKITMPYVLFVTTPYLITQFIGNFNNFNVIYFLTAGRPDTLSYYQAGKTDLLVTWLYKLTTGQMKDYSFASTIGILVFVISAVLSLSTYRKTASYNREEDFQ
ncbi:carbohydrate ABC transporter permease [Anaerocolumna xylanovorans]|uniref:Maltose/maltodextrin transport system permease protein n=1 Tax=Anaerocolumna xylanovorans DSM 12503 TaxID=1121345 RepID=A0A1M7YMV2_9FIRM|nr:sugar ABC transporter permease [Anaerocolumna xylanovorans]SHO53876.1 carbohydrate ABC transporter membrane protein 1, CUT1 family [Anaerocolumna xylanovorans DSM 12503]